jgi:DNA primase
MSRAREITDEIRRHVTMLDVVAPHVTLRRSGHRYKGLCPFHSEKTPSFTVDPERGFFYCFGCHAGGDVFDFVMRMGSLTFGEARQELAERAGIQLEAPQGGEHGSGERERLLRAVGEGAAFFRAHLAGPAGDGARRYLASRGVDAGSRDRFRLGFAPPGWDNLVRALGARGFDPGVLEQAGLAIARPGGGGHYDALRDRLIFPIHDLQGRPIAFGGRVLDGGVPKYLNTRETALFTKGKTLYALSEGRDAIRETGEAVVVEGYTDALACHQYGVRNAVASLGTALTLDQLLLLKRFASRAVLIYDSDAAGIGAAERGLELFDQAELPVRVGVIPGESDPDAFLRREGAERFRQACSAALPIFDYRLALAQQRHDGRSVEGKVGIVNEVGQLIITVKNPVRQGEYVQLLADRLGVREEAIRGQLGRLRRGQPGAGAVRARTETPPVPEAGPRILAERELLHLLVASPGVRESLRGTVAPEAFIEPDHRELAEALLPGGEEASDPGRLRERLESETAVSLLSRFLIAEPHAKDPVRAAEACIRRIRGIELEERIDGLMGALRDADRARDLKRIEELQGELQKLQAQKQGVVI